MQAATQAVPISTNTLWMGRILSALPVLFMVMDGGTKLFNPPPVVEAMTALGYPGQFTVAIGVISLVSTLLYVVPRTSILGAILLTGYLGGAIAVQMRVEAPAFSLLLPLTLGLMLWGGLYLRDPRLRALIPLHD
jgi:hypothetical protein